MFDIIGSLVLPEVCADKKRSTAEEGGHGLVHNTVTFDKAEAGFG